MGIEALAEISRYYGSNRDYVIAGGGNTSFKDAETLYIKGSGMALADAVPEAFVRMDRKALAEIWKKSYPADNDEREKEVLADLMKARKPGEEQKRPSVETMLHDLLPFDYVVHLHPALVNGLTCSRAGESAMKEIFPEAVWIPSINPGYILSLEVKKALDEYKSKNGRPCQVIFLQNHGVFVAAPDVEGIKKIYEGIMDSLDKKIKRRPDFGGETNSAPEKIEKPLAAISGGFVKFIRNNEISAFVSSRRLFYPVSSAFTPDHIVYAGSDPLFIEDESENGLKEAWEKHISETGRPPKIAAVMGAGVFGIGVSEKAAALAVELFIDSIKVAVFTESFGGLKFMSQDKIDFINNWEVERFRTQVAVK